MPSYRWFGVASAIAGAVIAALWASGALSWTMHVALGVILTLACLAIALLAAPWGP